MCVYHFWANSIKGLSENIDIRAEDWDEALEAVRKHIERQSLKELDILTEVTIHCEDCGEIFHGYEHVDCLGHKEMTFDQLLERALNKDSKYRSFKKLHGHHHFDSGKLKADGTGEYK